MPDLPAPAADDRVLTLVLDAVREVKDQVIRLETGIGARLDGLDQRYIPRAEYEARHSDVRNLITRADARIEAEGKERQALEDKLVAARRYALSTSIAGAVAVVALLTLVLTRIS